MNGKRFELIIQAGAGDVPGVIRLRALLKSMWRSYRLRVITVRELQPPETGPTSTLPSDQGAK